MRGALVVTGAVLPIVAVVTWPRISRLEVETLVPEDRLRLLRRVPLFAPLNLSVLDRIAGAMSAVIAPAGRALMREGEPGDRYVVIEIRVGRGHRVGPAAADPRPGPRDAARSRCLAISRGPRP